MGEIRKSYLVVAVTITSALAVLVVAWLSQGAPPSLNRGGYELTAVLPTSAALSAGSDVRIAGLRVGIVKSIDRAPGGALVELDIDKKYGPLPRDSKIALRLRSLVGENYVSLQPGKSAARLDNGSTLSAKSVSGEYVDVEQILDVLKGPTRDRARELLQNVGGGLDGRGEELNDLLGSAAGFASTSRPILRVLEDERRSTARLVDDFGTLARDVGSRGDALREVARQARITFTAVAARDEALRKGLDELAPTLQQIRSTAAVLRSTTDGATPVLDDVATTLTRLRPAVRSLRPAASATTGLLNEAGRAAKPLSATLQEVAPLKKPAEAALPQVRKALCELNPALRYVKPYYRYGIGLIQNIGSATNFYDAQGHSIRLDPLVSENSLGTLSKTESDLLEGLLDDGLLRSVKTSGYNPLPTLDELGKFPPTTGEASRTMNGYKREFPRIQPDC